MRSGHPYSAGAQAAPEYLRTGAHPCGVRRSAGRVEGLHAIARRCFVTNTHARSSCSYGLGLGQACERRTVTFSAAPGTGTARRALARHGSHRTGGDLCGLSDRRPWRRSARRILDRRRPPQPESGRPDTRARRRADVAGLRRPARADRAAGQKEPRTILTDSRQSTASASIFLTAFPAATTY